jgi:hypothetical protein
VTLHVLTAQIHLVDHSTSHHQPLSTSFTTLHHTTPALVCVARTKNIISQACEHTCHSSSSYFHFISTSYGRLIYAITVMADAFKDAVAPGYESLADGGEDIAVAAKTPAERTTDAITTDDMPDRGVKSFFDFDTDLSEQNAMLVKRKLKVRTKRHSTLQYVETTLTLSRSLHPPCPTSPSKLSRPHTAS